MHCFIGADEHSGHKVGLTPSSYNFKPPKDAPHLAIKQYRQRKILWDWFVKEIKSCGKFDWALHNGDMIEGKGERSQSIELLTTSRDEQVEMAIEVVKIINAKKNEFIYGTPAHTSSSGEDFEDQIAKQFGNNNIHNEGHFELEGGFVIAAKHYIGNSSSPVSRATSITGAIIKQLLWATLGQQPKANLIVRSHIHRYVTVNDDFGVAIVTPALQGLGSRYGIRMCDGLPLSFGFLELNIESLDRWGIVYHRCPLPYQKATVIKV